ncbi:MAG TPA: lipoyl(octanoyl) transferase LipB [Candidatus Dormibacteraeota bacterium]|nr:lipoyl(octanoyl) transferase LipB [Candidatus Dormibacteraeota bacterium]
MKTCLAVDASCLEYANAYSLQKRLVAARQASLIPDVLLLCEHPHVITLGRNGKRVHLLASENLLHEMGVDFFTTDRGGDITYHGPGQIVGYPVLQLAEMRRDLVWYVRQLEEAMIRSSVELGIDAGRLPGKTGVWVPAEGPAREKLAAIGVHVSRWVTSHGFAYNVSTELRYFDLIVPCGIADHKTTSLERLLGRVVKREEVVETITRNFGDVFGRTMRDVSPEELAAMLEQAERLAALPAPASA